MTASASEVGAHRVPEPGDAPLDLRLVPSAVAAWVACALAIGRSSTEVLAVAGVAGVAACGVLGACAALGGREPPVAAPRVRTPRVLAGAGLVLAVAALVLAGAGVQLHVRERGELAALAADRAVVTFVGVVRADARPVASPWSSDDGDRRWAVEVSVLAVEGRGRSGPGGGAAVVLGDGRWADVTVGSTVQATGRTALGEPGDEAVASVSAWEAPVVVARAGAVHTVVDGLRAGLLDASDDLPGDARGLVPGAAVGDTSRVSEELDAAMRTSGLTHVTAVSGGHFAVLGAAVLGMTGRLPRRVRALVCAAVMAAFVLLVRPEPSVVRAAGMGAVALVGLLAGRRSRALPALSATVVVLLALDPWLARSYGFVLSVVATAAIVLLAPPLAARLPAAVPRWLALSLAVPVAAQAACAPVLVLLDPVVSVYAVPANLLAAPAMAPATLLGLAATVVAPLAPPLGHALAVLAGVPCSWVGLVARTAAGLEGARAPWPGGVGGALLLAAVTTVALALVLRSRTAVPPWVIATTAVALVLSVPAVRVPLLGLLAGEWPPPGWRVVLCDVGQGDALVVRTGPASAVVVDVGPDGGAADACLDLLGVDRVDLLVLTHHHADHVGGLAPVLEGREVVRALVSPVPEPAGQARRTLEALGTAGVQVEVGVAGAAGAAGDVRWTVLWPSAAPGSVSRALDPDGGDAAGAGRDGSGVGLESSAVNDASLVLRLSAPDLDVLALGDVEPPAQQELVRRADLGGVDVVKVAHHGSAHQSRALAVEVGADVALIGVGAENTYGHPAPATVDLYREAGGLVLTTDRCGPVAVGGVGGRLEVWASCL